MKFEISYITLHFRITSYPRRKFMKRKLRVSSEDTQPPESASRKSVSELDPLSVYLKQISYNKLLSIEEERELGIKIKKCKGDIANLLARIENTSLFSSI